MQVYRETERETEFNQFTIVLVFDIAIVQILMII